jgi:Asp-tRNA(Asn)/Glu-tRNA(Gln) amidotransferase A subunit family amidase
MVKRLGGAVLGKTVATEIAFALPGPTVNPHDTSRTPGGSSSGSAASVAAGFCSFAIGTQTAGSTIRPASFCGVTGYKPSFGLLHTEGVQAISTTFDHLGLFAQSPRDAWLMTSAMLGRAEVIAPRAPGRLLHLRMPEEVKLETDMREAMEGLARELGADTRELPFALEDFAHLQETLCYWEAARILLLPGRMRLAEGLTKLLAPYVEMDVAVYAAARQRRAAYQAQFAELAAPFDAILCPAALGVAPPGLQHTGNALMSRFWTILHVPNVTVPLWRSAAGLPFAPQVVGKLGDDRALLQVAQFLFERRA